MPIRTKLLLTLAAAQSMLTTSGLAQPYVYVSNQQGTVSVVNTVTNAIVSSVKLDGASAGMAVDASGANLYVALIEANAVQVLAINGQATPILVTKIPVGAGPVHVGIANAAGLIYVANQYSNTVSVISKSSLKAIATVPVGSSPQGLAVSADGTRVFIANSMSSSISVLSVSTNHVVATWPALSGSGSIAISPDGTRAYVANQFANAVTVHDATSGKILSTFTVQNYPNSVAVSSSGTQLYVTNGNGGTLSVIDAASGKLAASVAVGPLPTSVALSTNGMQAYVTTLFGASVNVVSTSTNTITGSIPGVGVAGMVAVGPNTPPTQPPPPPTPFCTLSDQSACPPDSNNPHLAAYLANLNANLVSINSSIAGKPKTNITDSALLLPAAIDWMPTAAVFGTNINAYMDSLAGADIRNQEVNLWLGPLTAAAQYVPGGAQTFVPSDCANSSGKIPSAPPYVYLPLNATPHSGSGPYCTALAQYDSMFAHAAATGVTLRILGFKPSTDMLAACGNLQKPTELQYEDCVLPMAVAAATRWPSGFTQWQVIGEPLAGLAGALNANLSVSDVDTFIVHMATALHTANSKLTFGAAASALSYCNPPGSTCTIAQSDINYWKDWISGPAASWLEYLTLDVLSANCDLSNNYYANQLEQVAANFIAPAVAAGKAVQIGQSQHPTWCPAGGSAAEANAFTGYGHGSQFYLTSTVQDTWDSTFRSWASASGASIFTVYCSAPFLWYTSDPTRTSCTGPNNYTTQVLSHLPSTTSSGIAFGAMN